MTISILNKPGLYYFVRWYSKTERLGRQGKYLEKAAQHSVRYRQSAQHPPSYHGQQISVLKLVSELGFAGLTMEALTER
jgi:hypothetical protein